MGSRSSRPSFGNSMVESGCLWVSDEHRVGCFHCETPFSFKNRRHHCRVCGELFCDTKKATVNRDGTKGAKKATCWGSSIVLTSNLFPPELADAVEDELIAQYAKENGSRKGLSARSRESGAPHRDDADSAVSGEDSNNMFLRERYEDPKTRNSSGADVLLGKEGKRVRPMNFVELAELLIKPQRVCAVCFFMLRTPLLRPLVLNVRSLLSDRDPHNVFVVRVVLHGVTHKRGNGRHDHFVSLEAMAAAERNEANLEALVFTMMTDRKRLQIQNSRSNRAGGVDYGGDDVLPSLNQNPEVRDLASAMNFMVKLLRVDGESCEGNTENGNLVSTTIGEAPTHELTDEHAALAGREAANTAPFISVSAGGGGALETAPPGSNTALVAAAGATSSNSLLFTADPSSPMITDEERTTFFANGLLLLGAKHPDAGPPVGAITSNGVGPNHHSNLEHAVTLNAVAADIKTRLDTGTSGTTPVALNKNSSPTQPHPTSNVGSYQQVGSYPMGTVGSSLPFGGRALISTLNASNANARAAAASATDYNDLSKRETPQSPAANGVSAFDDGSAAPFPQRVFGGSGYYEMSLEQWRPFNKQTRLVFRTPDAAEVSDRPHNFGTVGVETHHTVKLRKVHATPKAAAIAERVDIYEMTVAAEEKAKLKAKKACVVSEDTMKGGEAAVVEVQPTLTVAKAEAQASHNKKPQRPEPLVTGDHAASNAPDMEDRLTHTGSGPNTPRHALHSKHRLSSPTSQKEKAELKAALHRGAAEDEEDEANDDAATTKEAEKMRSVSSKGSSKKASPLHESESASPANVSVPPISLNGDDLTTPLLSNQSTSSVPAAAKPVPAANGSTLNSFGAASSNSGGGGGAAGNGGSAGNQSNSSAPTSARARSSSAMMMMGRPRSEFDDFLPTFEDEDEKKRKESEMVDYTKTDLVVSRKKQGQQGASVSDINNGSFTSARKEASQGNLLKKDDRNTMGNFAAQIAIIDEELKKERNTSSLETPPMGPSSVAPALNAEPITNSNKKPSNLNNESTSPNYYNNLLLHNSFQKENGDARTPRANSAGAKGGPHKRSGSTLRLSPSPAIFTAFNPQARSGVLTPAEAAGVGAEVGSVYAYTQSNFGGASEKNLNAQVTKSQFRDGTVSISNHNHDYDGNNEAKVSALKKKARRGKRQMDLNLNIDDKQLEVTMPAAWSLGCSSVVGVDVVEGEAIGGDLYSTAVGEVEGDRLVDLQARAAREQEAHGTIKGDQNTTGNVRHQSSLRFTSTPQVLSPNVAAHGSSLNTRPKTSIRSPNHISSHGHSVTIGGANPIATSYLNQPLVVPLGVAGRKYLRVETFQEIFYFSIGNNQFDEERNIARHPNGFPTSSAAAQQQPCSKVVSCIRHPCVATAIETRATPSTPGYRQQRDVLDRISNATELCHAVKRAVDVSHVRGRVRVSSVKILKANDDGPQLVAGNGPYPAH